MQAASVIDGALGACVCAYFNCMLSPLCEGSSYGKPAWLSGIGHRASARRFNHVAAIPTADPTRLAENTIGSSVKP